MDNLIISLVFLIFGVMIIVILRRIALDLNVVTIFQNSFFWLSVASLATLLTYVVVDSDVAQAKPDQTIIDSGGTLPLPPSDTPPKEDAWQVAAMNLQAEYQDANFAIYAEDLKNSTRKIKINSDIEMPTASVYKIAVAYSILKAVSEGLSWNSPIWNTTLEDCFDKMIIESNNECAHAWGDIHGWQTIVNEFATLGLHINLYEQTTSTAEDIAGFLKKVYRGEILNDELIEKLLSTMKIQRYRQGIPTGTVGKAVADKVGFMNGVLNDAGIVFGNDGDYVLVIFTNGYSWESIARIARLIDENY